MTEQLQVPPAEFQSYYGKPILKLPRWKEPHLPAYLFLGGLSGGSAVMGAAAAATGRDALARAGRLTSAAAAFGGTGFLIAELGRPERFLNMLRVAKPTSPMSMGSWLLAAHSGLAGAAAASELTGVLPKLGAASRPLARRRPGRCWLPTRRCCWPTPPCRAGTGASAGACRCCSRPARWPRPPRPAWAGTALRRDADRGPAVRMAVLGAAVETSVALYLEHRPGLDGEPFRTGGARRMLRASQWLTPAGGVVALAAGRSLTLASAAAAGLLAGGAIATRFGVFRAGVASVADPKYGCRGKPAVWLEARRRPRFGQREGLARGRRGDTRLAAQHLRLRGGELIVAESPC